jgi:hypothetical protein
LICIKISLNCFGYYKHPANPAVKGTTMIDSTAMWLGARISISKRLSARTLLATIMILLGGCVSGDRLAGDRDEAHCRQAGFVPDTPEFDNCYRDEILAQRCELAGLEPGSDACYYEQNRFR